MNLGDAIKIIRTARKIKQIELAESLGVSANYISLIEAGKKTPSIKFLRQIAFKLKVPAGLFLLWSETETQSLRSSQLSKLRELLINIQEIYLQDESAA
jgi:transcriptional regulator with XRE-family HTH domain